MEGFFGKGNRLITELWLSRQKHLSSGCENWILSLNVLSASTIRAEGVRHRKRLSFKRTAPERSGCWKLQEGHDAKTQLLHSISAVFQESGVVLSQEISTNEETHTSITSFSSSWETWIWLTCQVQKRPTRIFSIGNHCVLHYFCLLNLSYGFSYVTHCRMRILV